MMYSILRYLYLKGVHMSDPVPQGMVPLRHVNEMKAGIFKSEICFKFVTL